MWAGLSDKSAESSSYIEGSGTKMESESLIFK